MAHWLWVHFGIGGTGSWYAFWSGAGSDIGELAIVGGLWRLANCHQDGCWRVGVKTTVEDNGHHFRRCSKHHKERHT